MKTLNFKNFTTLVLGALIALSVACDKKSSDPAPAVPATSYGYQNGMCVDLSNGAPAAANLCQNGNYRWNGAQCVDVNGGVVAQNLCTQGSGSYRWNGNQCTDLNGQIVSTTFCTNAGVNNYRWNGVACTDMNGVAVGPELCQSNNGIGGQYQLVGGECYSGVNWVPYSMCAGQGGYVAGQCYGTYIKYKGGQFGSYYYTKYCSGNSCSGETLLEYATRRPVVCP